MHYIKYLSFFITFFLWTNSENDCVINIKTKGIEENTKVTIQTQSENGTLIDLTSGIITNQKLELKTNSTNSYELAFIKVGEFKQNIAFILEKGSINIDLELESNDKIISKLSGTNQNNKFQVYSDNLKVLTQKMKQFQEDNKDKMALAQKNNDTATAKDLMDEYNKFQDEMNVNSIAFITNNPDSYISILLLENFASRGYFKSEELEQYLSKLDKKVLQTKNAIKIKNTIQSSKATEIGGKAPDFEALNPDGKMISLNKSLGKVTIIDFWASWCGPCRKENPNVVAMYNELHDKGLNIIGVSLDNPNGKEKWLEAIQKDGLIWNHVSNLKGWNDPIAVLYNIKSIPATYILDSKGNIVAKNLRGEELKAKIKELLGVQ
jgi:peroxiredoxin